MPLSHVLQAFSDRSFGHGNAGFAAGVFALQEPGHVSPEDAHDLQSFQVLPDLLRAGFVHHVPVLRRNYRHLGQRKIFVQLIKRCRRASLAGHFTVVRFFKR